MLDVLDVLHNTNPYIYKLNFSVITHYMVPTVLRHQTAASPEMPVRCRWQDTMPLVITGCGIVANRECCQPRDTGALPTT